MLNLPDSAVSINVGIILWNVPSLTYLKLLLQESEVEDEEDREEDEDEDEGAITFQNENSASNINNSPVSVLNIEEPMLLLDMKYGASQSTSAKSGSGN
jgi:hypothetical protein